TPGYPNNPAYGHVRDANGNKLDGVRVGNVITYTDTTGATALSYDNSFPTHTATYTDANGTPQSGTITSVLSTVQTAFGCPIPYTDLIGNTSPVVYLPT